jgi:hypothetical protein
MLISAAPQTIALEQHALLHKTRTESGSIINRLFRYEKSPVHRLSRRGWFSFTTLSSSHYTLFMAMPQGM